VVTALTLGNMTRQADGRTETRCLLCINVDHLGRGQYNKSAKLSVLKAQAFVRGEKKLCRITSLNMLLRVGSGTKCALETLDFSAI